MGAPSRTRWTAFKEQMAAKSSLVQFRASSEVCWRALPPAGAVIRDPFPPRRARSRCRIQPSRTRSTCAGESPPSQLEIPVKGRVQQQRPRILNRVCLKTHGRT